MNFSISRDISIYDIFEYATENEATSEFRKLTQVDTHSFFLLDDCQCKLRGERPNVHNLMLVLARDHTPHITDVAHPHSNGLGLGPRFLMGLGREGKDRKTQSKRKGNPPHPP